MAFCGLAYSNLMGETFVCNWTLEPFSISAYEKGQFIVSPFFVVERLNKTRWCLRLYPMGHKMEGRISCYLMRDPEDCNPDGITICFSLQISAGYSLTTASSPACKLSESFELGEANGFMFPNNCEKKCYNVLKDVFNIQCRMWMRECDTQSAANDRTDIIRNLIPEFNSVKISSLPEVFEVVDKESKCVLKYQDPIQLCMHTRFELERRSISFSIENTNQTDFVIIPSTVMDSPCLILFVSFTDMGDVQFEIQRSGETQMFVKCTIKINEEDKSDISVEDQHLFPVDKEEDVWNFSSVTKRKEIFAKKNHYDKNDIFNFHCEFTISYKGKETHTLGHICFPDTLNPSFDINDTAHLQDRLQVYDNKKICDVKLRVGEKTFPSNKAILCSSSVVFNDMFDSDTTAKNTGVLEVTDLDTNTVICILEFLESGALDLQGFYECDIFYVKPLYSASYKYKIVELQKQCSIFFMGSISKENVCDILILADEHHDFSLKRAAINFITNNAKETFSSNDWNHVMSYNLKFAADVMRHIFLNVDCRFVP